MVAIAILYSTIMGKTVQLSGLRQQVYAHYSRGLSYLKIGLRWLQGIIHQGRELLELLPLPYFAPERCDRNSSSRNRLLWVVIIFPYMFSSLCWIGFSLNWDVSVSQRHYLLPSLCVVLYINNLYWNWLRSNIFKIESFESIFRFIKLIKDAYFNCWRSKSHAGKD